MSASLVKHVDLNSSAISSSLSVSFILCSCVQPLTSKKFKIDGVSLYFLLIRVRFRVLSCNLFLLELELKINLTEIRSLDEINKLLILNLTIKKRL